jgi:hypothetical protein
MRRTQPAVYLKICALLVPREMKLEPSGGVKAMTDEQLDAALECGRCLRRALARRRTCLRELRRLWRSRLPMRFPSDDIVADDHIHGDQAGWHHACLDFPRRSSPFEPSLRRLRSPLPGNGIWRTEKKAPIRRPNTDQRSQRPSGRTRSPPIRGLCKHSQEFSATAGLRGGGCSLFRTDLSIPNCLITGKIQGISQNLG